MGGSRSGRYGWRGVIENRKRLDIRKWRQQGWLTPSGAGTLTYSDGGTIAFALRPDDLTLSYQATNDDGEQHHVAITIPIRRTPCRYGGERAYWACPNCHKRREVVVMASNGKFWGCRTCLRLRYISQGLAPHHRMQRRAEQLYNRAGDEHEDGLIYKRKRMRWRTFNRLMDRANAISVRSDDEWATHMDGCLRGSA